MTNTLTVIQVIFAILLIATILLQQRGTGLGGVFGGEGSIYRTKRGLEKMLLWGSVGCAVLFLASSFLLVVVR